MQPWKRLSSRNIGLLVRSKFVHYAEKIGPDDPFWQASYSSFNLYSEEKVREKLTYMHENPVAPAWWPSRAIGHLAHHATTSKVGACACRFAGSADASCA